MNDELRNLKEFFSSKRVYLPDIWLESCMSWCKAETLPPNYTAKDLQLKVYAQWLLLNLCEVIEEPILPDNLSSQKEYTLQGTFCLQIMKIVDISKPKLWQLQRIRKNLVKNVDPDKDFGSRMLLLYLSDGVRYVEAMEFRPIKVLNINLAPGIKIKIVGPVKVRRGQLMLEPRHVVILGGEVEELLVVNHPENVLARELGLEENPNPGNIEEKNMEVTLENTQNIPPSVVPNNVNTRQVNNRDVIVENRQNIVGNVVPNNVNTRETNNRTPDMFDDMEFEEEQLIKLEKMASETESNLNKKETFEDDFPSDLDLQLAEIEELNDIIPCSSRNKTNINVITLGELLRLKESKTEGKYKAKVKFKAVAEKLSLKDESFRLSVNVCDDNTEVEVKMDSSLVSDMLGYSPQALQDLKDKVADRDNDATYKIISAMQRLKSELTKLDGLVELTLSNSDDRPTLTTIL